MLFITPNWRRKRDWRNLAVPLWWRLRSMELPAGCWFTPFNMTRARTAARSWIQLLQCIVWNKKQFIVSDPDQFVFGLTFLIEKKVFFFLVKSGVGSVIHETDPSLQYVPSHFTSSLHPYTSTIALPAAIINPSSILTQPPILVIYSHTIIHTQRTGWGPKQPSEVNQA